MRRLSLDRTTRSRRGVRVVIGGGRIVVWKRLAVSPMSVRSTGTADTPVFVFEDRSG